jgi:hypothetical protein
MNHYLAVGSSSSPGGTNWYSTVLFIVLIAGTAILGTIIVRRIRVIRGPVVAGTAQVLSLKQFGSVATNGPERIVCRFRLRVQILGHEPYEVAHWQNIPAWEVGGVAPGRTVSVEVAEANPKRLRIGPPSRQGVPTHGYAGQPASTHTVINMPPKVVFNQMSSSANPEDLADLFKQGARGGPVLSAADLLASGQRVPGALKSFSAMGTTPRSLGRTPSRPEFIDAPHYTLEVELHFPNLAPMTARAIQPVPLSEVPNLAIGLKLDCAVDPADPSHRFVVDWPQL